MVRHEHEWVSGKPIAQPRVKAARVGGFVRMYTPKTADAWKDAVAKAWEDVHDLDATSLECTFYFYAPKSRRKELFDGCTGAPIVPHRQKPDGDNLIKAVADALVKAGVIQDDARIHTWRATKYWCLEKDDEGAFIEIGVDD